MKGRGYLAAAGICFGTGASALDGPVWRAFIVGLGFALGSLLVAHHVSSDR